MMARASTLALGFNYGTRAERRQFLERRNRSASRPRAQRGHNKARFNPRPGEAEKMMDLPSLQVKLLVTFPHLSVEDGKAKVGEIHYPSGWNSLFKDPRLFCEERILSYTKPLAHGQDELPFVIVSKEAVLREATRWEKSIVAYIVGKKPHFLALKACLEAQWKVHYPFQMHSLADGFFLFRFSEDADRDKVLHEEPWNFYGRPIVVKEWSIGMELKKDQFNALPIWIRLPNLDLRFWDVDSIGKIASVVGHPRFVYEAIANRDRLCFARACVEITPDCEFPTCVNILVGTKWSTQEILYEWRPTCCRSCNTFDHAESCCIKIQRKNDVEAVDSRRMVDIPAQWQVKSHREKVCIQKSGPETILNSNSKWPEIEGKENWTSINARGESSNPFQLLQSESPAIQEDLFLVEPNMESHHNDDLCIEARSEEEAQGRSRVDPDLGKSDVSEDGSEVEVGSEENATFDFVGDGCEGGERSQQSVVCETPENMGKSDGEKADGLLGACNVAAEPETPILNQPFEKLLDSYQHGLGRSGSQDVEMGRAILSRQLSGTSSKCRTTDVMSGKESHVSIESHVHSLFPGYPAGSPDRPAVSCEDDGHAIPPCYMPPHDGLLELKESRKDGATSVLSEHQVEPIGPVILVKDGDSSKDSNFVTFNNLRRSPRLRKKPAKLADSTGPTGPKKGTFK